MQNCSNLLQVHGNKRPECLEFVFLVENGNSLHRLNLTLSLVDNANRSMVILGFCDS